MPPSRPDAEPMVPWPGLLLVHVPPGVASDNVVVCPTHTDVAPVIAAGDAFTVNDAVLVHPAVVVYVIVTTPGATPVTVPLLLPTVAIVPSLVVHVPPGVASVSVRVEPTQTLKVPPIAAGSALTVTTVEALQPASAYVIVADTGPIAVTSPDDEPTVATPELLVVHTPPEVL